MQLGSPADLRRRFCTGRPCLDLVHTGGEGALARWEIVNHPDDLGHLLGVILGLPLLPASEADLAAVDLFGGPLARRIRVCAADNCGLLLVDTSRPGRRRWCSMEFCGNRAKIRTHRSRA